jgi:hypothetical protein
LINDVLGEEDLEVGTLGEDETNEEVKGKDVE